MTSMRWLPICVALLWASVPYPVAAQDAEVADCLNADLTLTVRVAACQEAAENGDAEAQFNLAVMYGNGEGVPQDYTEARVWLLRAAEQGHVVAQFSLGALYAEGAEGIPQDYAEAVVWWRRAAEQGHVFAQLIVAHFYRQGRGVAQDAAEAIVWYRRVAEQGNVIGQYKLAAMYAKGEGVPRNYTLAHMWFDLAGAGGNEEARERRDKIAEQMTPAQIAEAQRLAGEWVEAHRAGGK